MTVTAETARPVRARHLARAVERELAARRPVVVAVAGYGAGWYVTGVDWRRRMFTVRRSGDPIDVAWDAVRPR